MLQAGPSVQLIAATVNILSSTKAASEVVSISLTPQPIHRMPAEDVSQYPFQDHNINLLHLCDGLRPATDAAEQPENLCGDSWQPPQRSCLTGRGPELTAARQGRTSIGQTSMYDKRGGLEVGLLRLIP